MDATAPAASPTAELDEIYEAARKLDVIDNLMELEAYGFTVVEPHKVAPPDFQQAMLEAVLRVHERRTGQQVEDLATAGLPHGVAAHNGMLFEEPVFEDALLNPAVLTIARYLTGLSTNVSNFVGLLRSDENPEAMPLHTDSEGVPPPMPSYAQVCNVTWIHTDYSRDAGSVALVPGSHRFGREPMRYEEDGYRDDSPVKPIAIDAPAGSLICWHGNTWHGAFPRTMPGLRVNTLMYFCRSYVRQMIDFAGMVSDEVLERNPPEFARLLGRNHPWPLQQNGRTRFPEAPRLLHSGRNPWA